MTANSEIEATTADADLLRRRRHSLAATYRLFYDQPVHPVRGEGAWLYDADGSRYLDAYNNVPIVGHSNPEVVAALSKQSALLNTHTRYLSIPIVEYAERLLALFPTSLDRVVFTCTGSEANDLAMRLAQSYTGGDGFIITANAYHGDTAASSALSPSLGLGAVPHVRTVRPPHIKEPIGRFAADVAAAARELEESGHRTAALIIDTIMSSDGILPEPTEALLPAVHAIHEAGGVFIADEVQAGLGRLGDGMWGFARHHVEPDIVTLGKPMGNGYPLAGVISRRELFDPFGQQARYFNTFAGNPVSAMVGMTVLEIIERDSLVEHSRQLGHRLRQRLDHLRGSYPVINDIRGAGLFIGVQLRDPSEGGPGTKHAAAIVNAMRKHRVLISATGPDADVLKIRPPMIVTDDQGRLLCDALEQVLADLAF